MLDFIKIKLPSWTNKLWTVLWQWVGIPLLTLFVSSVVILRFYNWLGGPDALLHLTSSAISLIIGSPTITTSI